MAIAGLVEQARNGDEAAFTEQVKSHQNLVLGFAYNRLGDFHRAEDVVQDTFVVAQSRLGSLKDPAAFPYWLRGIALMWVNPDDAIHHELFDAQHVHMTKAIAFRHFC